MENRLRTTLTHEYGHVHFHQFMFEVESRPGSLFEERDQTQSNRCKRDTIVSAAESDWMEWQAGYVCGAILMPAGPLIDTVQAFRARTGSLEQSRTRFRCRQTAHRRCGFRLPDVARCRASPALEETDPEYAGPVRSRNCFDTRPFL